MEWYIVPVEIKFIFIFFLNSVTCKWLIEFFMLDLASAMPYEVSQQKLKNLLKCWFSYERIYGILVRMYSFVNNPSILWVMIIPRLNF